MTADELDRFVVSHCAVRPSAGLRAGTRRAGRALLPPAEARFLPECSPVRPKPSGWALDRVELGDQPGVNSTQFHVNGSAFGARCNALGSNWSGPPCARRSDGSRCERISSAMRTSILARLEPAQL